MEISDPNGIQTIMQDWIFRLGLHPGWLHHKPKRQALLPTTDNFENNLHLTLNTVHCTYTYTFEALWPYIKYKFFIRSSIELVEKDLTRIQHFADKKRLVSLTTYLPKFLKVFFFLKNPSLIKQTTYIWNNVRQKCEGICGLWVS